MKTICAVIFLAGVFLVVELSGAAGVPGFDPKAVIPSQRRLQSLEAANRVLVERPTTWKETIKRLPDPFFRDNLLAEDVEAVVEVTDGQVSDKSDLEILRGVAEQLHPTGTLELGSGHYLLLGGKRIKVGDELPLVFEGIIYRITISSVKRNSYTLRLNDEELRREFK